MSRFAAPIAESIWDMKYRLKEADGTPIDGTVEDTWRRIARSLAVNINALELNGCSRLVVDLHDAVGRGSRIIFIIRFARLFGIAD